MLIYVHVTYITDDLNNNHHYATRYIRVLKLEANIINSVDQWQSGVTLQNDQDMRVNRTSP